MSGRYEIEAGEMNGRDADRFALRDGDGDVGFVLFVVQLDVEGGNTRIGVTAVCVVRPDAFEISVESRLLEGGFLTPRQLGTDARGEHALQLRLVNRLDPAERQGVDLNDAAVLASAGNQRDDGQDGQTAEDAHGSQSY